jgi:fatty acid desaturase
VASTTVGSQRPIEAPRVYDLEGLERRQLVDAVGVAYLEFRRSLNPRYARMWAQLLAGYAALIPVAAATVALSDRGMGAIAIPLGGLLMGYAIAYVELFFHEAAHYNVAPSKARNDRLANLLIGALVGQDINAYRVVHFGHHRNLGTPGDTERTYLDPLNIRFIAEGLLGVKVAKVMAVQRHVSPGRISRAQLTQLLLGLLINATILGATAVLGWWSLTAAWILAVVVFLPFFAAVRQLLEHRADDARQGVDYRVMNHGAVTRMFGGPLDATLGSAGFNRHLLHHWDPGVSCTRLADVEAFLLGTDAAVLVKQSRTTYLRTFARLFGH